jgi:predicted methyltransferase
LTGLFSTARAQDQRNESEWERRDAWQRPAEVMDALRVAPGSAVADIGAGRGYFTMRLAQRVGLQGRVFAVDTDANALGRLRERAEKEGLKQVTVVESANDDPRLDPGSVDAILVVNAFHEMREFDAMLAAMHRALKPGGLLGIIDSRADPGKPRSEYFSKHAIPEELVREDAERNGFRFSARKPGFRDGDGDQWFFLVFEKPKP